MAAGNRSPREKLLPYSKGGSLAWQADGEDGLLVGGAHFHGVAVRLDDFSHNVKLEAHLGGAVLLLDLRSAAAPQVELQCQPLGQA